MLVHQRVVQLYSIILRQNAESITSSSSDCPIGFFETASHQDPAPSSQQLAPRPARGVCKVMVVKRCLDEKVEPSIEIPSTTRFCKSL